MKISKDTIIFICVCAICCLNAMAQHDYSFRNITAQDGLPDNHTSGVFFAPDGRLGIITTAQISLYDGNSFVSYPYRTQSQYYWTKNNIPPYKYVDANHRLWIKQRNILYVFDLETESFIENVDSLVRSFGITEHLANFFVDEGKRLWFVSSKGELQYFDTIKQRLESVAETHGLKDCSEEILAINGIGDYCWIVYGNGVIRCYDVTRKRFISEDSRFTGQISPENRVMISPLDNGDLWIMWNKGIAYYDRKSDRWVESENIHLTDRDVFTTLEVDKDGNAWVGSGLSGIYIIDRDNFTVTHYESIPIIGGEPIENDITNIIINKDNGGIWVSFLFKGIAYSHESMNKFSRYSIPSSLNSSDFESIRCMVETADGDILLGTADGVFRFNPKTKRIDLPYQELSHKLCYVMYRDSKDRIWVGTLYDGLYCIDQERVRRYYNPAINFHNYRSEINYNSVRNILEDNNGYFWVAVAGGLSRFNSEDGTFVMLSDSYPEILPYTHCISLLKDESGQIIVGSSNGLYYYNPLQKFVWRPEVDAPKDSRFIHTNNKYNCIFCDSRGLYWFGTQYGLNIVDMESGNSYCISSENGMPNNIVSKIIEDDNHDVWVSTANGICRITANHKKSGYEFDVIGFNQYDGCLEGEYSFGSGLKASDGTIYFGGVGGFNAFTPRTIAYNNKNKKPIITGIQLFNTPIVPGKEYKGRIILDKSLSYTKNIELSYEDNFITFEFTGLNFVNPNQTYYRYKLEGFDNEWHELSPSGSNGKAVYTGLPPGKYTFKVFTADNNKKWGDDGAELNITIRPPFWETVWAYIFYAVCVMSAIAALIYYFDKRNKEQAASQRKIEAERQREELNQMKFRFFTNVSHEFRTPLTLIITPLEAFINKMPETDDRKRLSSIYHHALDLLTLVNQLLDFRKLEMHGEKLHLMNGDIVEFVRQSFLSFKEHAAERRILFQLDLSGMEELYMNFDSDKIHKVLNNLLSNAFKFTNDGGQITVRLRKIDMDGKPFIQIEVSDTGIGIGKNDLPHIFERFYQTEKPEGNDKPGSGIGLHMIKEYIELHSGSVSVESALGKGSTFSINIPSNLKTADTPVQTISDTAVEPAQPENVSEKPLLLVVEDNNEFRTFLKEQLSDCYRVLDAPDGEEGEKLAVSENPDLIISDIMMPVVDGIELCRRIKNNIQTSHIPVILLTARASDESKAVGYEAGADSYISKPFSIIVLLTRIRKLIEQQQQRRETFHKEIVVTPSTITITSLDEQLVQQALLCVERNIDNAEYSVDNFAEDMAMSRPTLYRKLLGITGQTPKDFIVSIRLKRAAQLLKDTQLTIAEISNKTGFTSPRNFAKLFKERFGVLPSQYKMID